MLLEISYFVAFIFSMLFAYYDLKKGEVENWVSYFPLAFGIIYWLIVFWMVHKNFLFSAIEGAMFFYFIGLALYYFAGFGGADVRFLTALGALLPSTPHPDFILSSSPFFVILLYNFSILLVFLTVGYIFYHFRDNYRHLFVDFKNFFQKNLFLTSITVIFAFIYLLLFALFNFFAFLLGFLLICFTLLILSQHNLFITKVKVKAAKGKEISQAIIKNGKIIAPAWSKITPELLNLLKQKGVQTIYIKNTFLPAGPIFPLLVIFTYFFGAIGF